MPSRFLALMCDQHQQLLSLFAAATGGGAVVDAARYEQFRRQLVQHIAIEEKVLMPALAGLLGQAFETVRNKLQQDHAAILALLVPTPNEVWLEDLREILVHHFAVEASPGQLHALAELYLRDDDQRLGESAAALPAIVLEPCEDGRGAPEVLARMMAAVGLNRPRSALRVSL
jgi:hypothetical protein